MRSHALSAPRGLALVLLAGCGVQLSVGVAADSSGGVGLRAGVSGRCGVPSKSGSIHTPMIAGGATVSGRRRAVADVSTGYEYIRLPDKHGWRYAIAGGVGILGGTWDGRGRADAIVTTTASISRARSKLSPCDRSRPRKPFFRGRDADGRQVIDPSALIQICLDDQQWNYRGIELGAATTISRNPMVFGHLSLVFGWHSYPAEP